MFNFDWEVKAMFTLADGRKVFVFSDTTGLHRALVMDRVMMSTLNTKVDYIEISTMGIMEPERIPHHQTTTCELFLEGTELVEGYDLFQEYDPVNQKSNNELLTILNQRYAKEKFDEKP